MSVDNPDVVDFVAFDQSHDAVLLVVADQLDWSDELAQLLVLQEKLNRYVVFVESGELIEQFPDAKNRSVRFEIRFLHEPSAHATSHFLMNARHQLEGAGIELCWTPGPREPPGT